MTDTWNKGVMNEMNEGLMFVSLPKRTDSNYCPPGFTLFDCAIARPGGNSHDFARDHISLTTMGGKVLGYIWQTDKHILFNTKPDPAAGGGSVRLRSSVGGEVVLSVNSAGGVTMQNFQTP